MIYTKAKYLLGDFRHDNFAANRPRVYIHYLLFYFCSLEKGVLDDRGNKQTDRPTHWDPIALEDPFSSLPEIKIILSTALDILIVASIASL